MQTQCRGLSHPHHCPRLPGKPVDVPRIARVGAACALRHPGRGKCPRGPLQMIALQFVGIGRKNWTDVVFMLLQVHCMREVHLGEGGTRDGTGVH